MGPKPGKRLVTWGVFTDTAFPSVSIVSVLDGPEIRVVGGVFWSREHVNKIQFGFVVALFHFESEPSTSRGVGNGKDRIPREDKRGVLVSGE